MRLAGCVALFMIALSGTALADVAGAPTVFAGDVLSVNGTKLHLYGIVAPQPGQMCRAKGKRYPCGHVAKTALMDLVIGSEVTCRLRTPPTTGIQEAHCTVGGFDLAANMVHTGWALADRGTGAKYEKIEKRARQAKRGLWRGQFNLAGRSN